VYLNSATATITLDETDNVEIQFETWTSPKSPMVITGIFVGTEISVDRRNMLSINRKIVDRSDDSLPSYGIISNSGNVSFNDIDGKVLDYAEQQLLQSELSVSIYITNTLTKKQEEIGYFSTDTWNYDNNNNSVSVSLKDELQEWQNISIEGFYYNPKYPFEILANGTMAELYTWLLQRTPRKYKMLYFRELDEKTQEILQNTKIKYPLLESGTLWKQWSKLCEVCGLYIYKNNKGQTVCSYSYGS
jgi:hypothetical protein